MTRNRKRIRHYHELGDCHELTFSCFQNKFLLTNADWNLLLCESINRALARYEFGLIAFVIMPNHLHLLVYPKQQECQVDRFLFAIKRPFSYRIKQLLQETQDRLLDDLTIRDRPGSTVFRFWQEGAGYDRNLSSLKAVEASIDYIHMNPVRKKLVDQSRDWKWSSARWYESEGELVDSDLPELSGLPWDFF
ncbi:REP-associated tyrosine transposase [Gimesia algae]|uniref:Transposase IS200 like protein n=1 Tax=Gimesia algae TaxID=2527971 RepID=A0A517V9G3_9PLAN|nr:Transposase IS200 like protein [Gimesia algae]